MPDRTATTPAAAAYTNKANYEPTRKEGHDADLQDRVCALLNGRALTESGEPIPQITLTQFHLWAGVSKSAISAWIGGKYGANPAILERKMADTMKRFDDPILSPLRRPEQEKAKADAWFTNNVVRRVHNTLDLSVRHRHLCGIISEVGLGKTIALRMYVREHPTYQLIELNRAMGGGSPSGIADAFFRAIDGTRYRRNERSKGTWLCDHFAPGDRLVVIDNAEMLSRRGVEWVLDFYNHTGCPMALVGNDELVATIRQVKRAVSRVLPLVELDFTPDKQGKHRATEYVDKSIGLFLTAHWPAAGKHAGVIRLCETILTHPGRLRALSKLTDIAKGWVSDGSVKDPEQALRDAMSRSAVDYKLEV